MTMNKDPMRGLCDITLVIFVALAGTGWAQLSEAERWVAQVGNAYEVEPNVTYLVVNNYEAKLDVYYPPGAKAPVPVVMAIHGGGWIEGTKEESIFNILPYLQMGFAVVNVEYRLAKVSPAPAVVEDCLCALHWVGRNAQKYHFDLSKVIVTDESAGGYLALSTAMIPSSAGFENECAADDDVDSTRHKGPWSDQRPKVAAVINWYGITDVADMLQGPHIRSYAVTWLGSEPNRENLAKRISPLTYVRAGLPPVLTIHGDADRVVAYSHAIRLHDALNNAGVRNRLLTIPGGDHGDFTSEQQIVAYEAIHKFLVELGITAVAKQ
jgi:acetyl esterase/lipase